MAGRGHGPIHRQLQETLDYIRRKIIVEKVVKVEDKAEANRANRANRAYNYPYTAIEEVLSNVVYHKSYDDRNPIEVRIELNSIIVYSLAGPMPPITNADLQNERVVSRNYRNRRIGDFLKERDMTEGRSTGFPKIFRAMRNNGSPDPIFKTDELNQYFLAELPIHPAFVGDDVARDLESVDTLESLIINIITENKHVTRAEMAEAAKVSTKTIERQIKQMCRAYQNEMYRL